MRMPMAVGEEDKPSAEAADCGPETASGVAAAAAAAAG